MKIFIKDVDKLTNHEYAMARKNTFGASDVATLFGLGFKTLDEMLILKSQNFVTDEELAIGDLPSVRKGRDLEDFILNKYKEQTGKDVFKPKDMYILMEGLTVNYDGLQDDEKIPVEIKYVTTFGSKNYKTKEDEYTVTMPDEQYGNMKNHIKTMASQLGIPPYYYTQLQTQIYGKKAPHGVLVAWFEKDWGMRIYTCPKDPFFEKALPVEIGKAYTKLAILKGFGVKTEETKDFEY